MINRQLLSLFFDLHCGSVYACMIYILDAHACMFYVHEQTASSLSFSSDLVGAMHARGSGEAARRAKRGRQPLPSRAISHARGHLRFSRFARRTTEKRETARSLVHELKIKLLKLLSAVLFYSCSRSQYRGTVTSSFPASQASCRVSFPPCCSYTEVARIP